MLPLPHRVETALSHPLRRLATHASTYALQTLGFAAVADGNTIHLGEPPPLSVEEAAMAKYWCTEAQGRVIDACLQLHGGYGYMLEYPIARDWADARVSRIYGGTNEIMREVIGRALGLADRA